MPTPAVSIIIPAYNEELRLPAYLDRIFLFFTEKETDFEVIVVDDGSSDGTTAVAARYSNLHHQFRVITLDKNSGKGFAVKTGMLAATGDLRLFTDADGATPIEEFDRLAFAIQQGSDIAIASRALSSNSVAVVGTVHRKIMGTIFNTVIKLVTPLRFKDTQCGFKLFTRNAVDVFARQTLPGFAFDVEILLIAHKLGLRVAEVPVNWKDAMSSTVDLIRDPLKMFRDVLTIAILHRKGRI